MMTVFLFARLWRRSEVITDVELVELRYSGGSAAFLRGFRAIYFGVFMSSIIMGWINLAMAKVILTTMGIEKKEAILLCLPIMFIAMLYSSLSGLRGVLWTSLFQFVLMMGMTILLGIYSVKAVGGLAAMKEKLTALDAVRVAEGGSGSSMDFFPSFNSAWLPFTAFFVFIAVNWWATWYPGAEPGGGGYVAQRIFCAKDEKHSLWATMWFNVAHYALRPWPWILTALASVILYPELTDKEVGFIRMMTDHMPPALRGLMLASFLAAYMSTIATHLNWGASYFVNDFYQRFLAPNRSERHYVAISRLATLGLMMIGGGVSFFLESVADAWQFAHQYRSRDRGGVPAALVLVANQCLVGNCGHEHGCFRCHPVAGAIWPESFRKSRLRASDFDHGEYHERSLDRSYFPHLTSAERKAFGILSAHPADGRRMATDGHDGAGNPP